MSTGVAKNPLDVKTAAQPSFAALRHPSFRAYFVTSAIAMMADNIEHVISYWVMFQKFHSPALGGIAVLTHWLPFLFFSVYAGALADRFDSRRVIQVSMLVFIAVSLGWGLLFLADTIEIWHAVVLLTAHGLAGVLWGPASQMLIHDIVGHDQLQSAVRLNATSRSLGVLMAPAIGGGLMLLVSPAIGLLVNAVIYLPLIWWLWKTPHGSHKPLPTGRASSSGSFVQAFATLREVSGNRTIISMIALAGVSSLLVGNAFQAQMPEFAHDLGTEKADFSYSVLLAASAAGSLLGGVILESRGLLIARPQTAIVLTILWCLAITGFALATSYPVAVVLMLVAGFLNLSFSAMAQTLVQLQAPEHLRGRLIGVFNMSNSGLRAFSGVTVGIIGSLIGIHWSLALSALLLLTATIALLAFTVRGRGPAHSHR